jgi:hypothetical protein
MAIISLLMPTRHRVHRAGLFLQSVVDTADNLLDIEVVLAIDDDDKDSQKICSPHVDLKIVKVIAPRASMGELNTRCLNKSTGQIIMLVNDDIIIRTNSWDRYFIESSKIFEDEIYLIHTKDGFKDSRFPIFPVLSRKYCDLVKYPYPVSYSGDGIDAHIYDIFIRLKYLGYDREIYLPTVYFEHMHVALGKSNCDDVYSVRSPRRGSYEFYGLWQDRELVVGSLVNHIDSEKCYKVDINFSNKKNIPKRPFFLLLTCFFKSKQSLKYRLGYLRYNFFREAYFMFRLNRVKAWVLKQNV